MKTPTKIVELRAENVKRIRAVTIKPDGSLIVIGGKNAQGKSSVLDAIAYALGGKEVVDAEPLRRGEESGRVVLTLDDGTVVRRRFFPHGKTDLEIKRDPKAMPVTGPQTLLDNLTGKVAFDPLAFKSLDRGKRLLTVQKMVGLTFAEEDAHAERLFAERRDLKRDAERIHTEALAMPHYPEAKPGDRMSTAELEVQLEQANDTNKARMDAATDSAAARLAVGSARQFLGNLQLQREDLQRQLDAIQRRIEDGHRVIAEREKMAGELEAKEMALPVIDASRTAMALKNATEFNRRAQANEVREAAIAKAKDLFDRAEEMTRALDHLQKEKQRKIAEAKFPVAGMAFDRDGVTLNGLPFEQASDAEQLRASVLMAAALNPKLRVMLIKNGEKLDPDGLALLAALAEEHNLQIWLERVSEGAECSVIIEDGMEKGDRLF